MSRPPQGIPGQSATVAPLLRQRWRTISPAHAIQRAAVTLNFPEEIPSFVVNKAVTAVRETAKKLGLTKEEQVNSLLLQIGPGGAQQPSPMNQEGVAFQELQGAQVTQALHITRQSIRFESTNYTRWVAYRSQIESLLEMVLPFFSQVTPISVVGLEYVDFFFAVAEGPEDVGLVIDNQSHLIAKRAFRRRDPFHTHSGWFESRPSGGQNLVNVDVTVADANGPIGLRRTISIRTFEAEQVGERQDRGVQLSSTDAALAELDQLHVSLKGRLSSILTRDAQSMISLGG